MTELRQNPITKEWVIIAPTRGQRPNEFETELPEQTSPNYDPSCPFCRGNENMTPEEIWASYALPQKKWAVRVVPNKYPALTSRGNYTRKNISDFYRKMQDAIGSHEIVIESPQHNAKLGFIPDDQMKLILVAYKKRYLALCKSGYKLVTIFRNYGEAAGTSLKHPHSQILATPVVPNSKRYPIEEAMRYYDDNGACVFCDMINQELTVQDRIVECGRKLILFEPFASRIPYETWIMPVTHAASFAFINAEELKELAHLLNQFLKLIYIKLNNPSYNYVIQTIPCKSERNLFYHWSLIILPRLTKFAGFELGSGMHINNMYPEECAAILRDQK
jgi:UDPglucose--hexose-1-phosphate uridylyltransferase